MVEPTLEFIAKQLERVLAEQRDMHGEILIIRGEIQTIKSTLYRLDYSITDILDRLRKLEEEKI